MIKRRRLLVAIALLMFSVAALGAAAWSIPGIRWRIQVAALKASGQLSELGWSRMVGMLMPGGDFWLRPLLDTRNPYVTITNPFTTPADVEQGRATFRRECVVCHGIDGRGGRETGLTGYLRHGGSDWALFQTIADGIPGTAMAPAHLPDRTVWSLVAFVRQVGRTPPQSALAFRTPSARAVTPEALVRATEGRDDWLTYSGSYSGQRYSALTEINTTNARDLRPQWILQLETAERNVETTPLVVDGVMFITRPPNDVLAVDAATGAKLWEYRRALPMELSLCCGSVNRGLAVLGTTLYLGTLDARLVALDARTGEVKWEVSVADYRDGYSITSAPLAVRDLIVVGVAGGEFGIRGFVDAYNAETGALVWRFYTVPGPGDPEHDTWEGESWKTGGAPTWLTGSYDPDLDLVYWGVGNPGPDYNADDRRGDNLYSNSVVALDRGSGALRWHFQFTPHDVHDWDAVQIPVLADLPLGDRERQVMLWANRNAFYYVLDRATGEFLLAREFARQDWAEGIDPLGRPIERPNTAPTREGRFMYPASLGATNWWSPSYSPRTHLLYVPVVEGGGLFFKGEARYKRGQEFWGGAAEFPTVGSSITAVRALRAETGDVAWEYVFVENRVADDPIYSMGGILSTAGDLVFAGRDRSFVALHARDGRELWRFNVGGRINASPITFRASGTQFVSVAAGRTVLTFGID